MNEACDILVIGGGISGLTTAFRLARRGFDVRLMEASPHAGGVIASERRAGLLFERGPNSILDTSPRIGELLAELGIRGERIELDPAARKRFVVRDNRLVPLPTSACAFVRTPLFSARAKLALLREPFIAPAATECEESVAQFVLRRLGAQFLDYAIEPFVGGLYAGDAARVSLAAAFPRLHALERRYGSLVKGQLFGARERKAVGERPKTAAASFSFTDGLQTLTGALSHALASVMETDTAARGVHAERGMLVVPAEQHGKASERSARAVVLAVPAYRAAALLRASAPGAAEALAAIPYAPLASVATAYRRPQVAHRLDGFGMLVPRVAKRHILGTLFSSSMFEGRAPEGSALLTTFVGGAREPQLLALSDAELAQIVCDDLGVLLGARGDPEFCSITRWPQALPQYTLGHLERVRRAELARSALPGLFLCASYRGGLSVGDCIVSACTTADIVARHLSAS